MKPHTEKRTSIVWVLPQRDQRGEDRVVSDGRNCKLSQVLDPAQLPKSLVLGIPEEVIERYGVSDELIFAQYIRQPERSVFALSVCCGRDRSNRVVFLTRLQFLPQDEFPREIESDPILSEEEREATTNLMKHFQDRSDKWWIGIRQMLEAAKRHRRWDSFANVDLHRVHFKPDWTPEKKKW